jgi:hypothetical protein
MLKTNLLNFRLRRIPTKSIQRFFSTGSNELKPYFKPSMSIATFKTEFSQLETFQEN